MKIFNYTGILKVLTIIVIIICNSNYTFSADTLIINDSIIQKNQFEGQLTGNWGGIRENLINNGIQIEGLYRGEVFYTALGNTNKTSVYLDNFDLMINADMGFLTDWEGALFKFHGIGSHGGDPAKESGVKQGISNIEAPNAWKIFQFYLEQQLFDKALSISFGLMDVNAIYDVKVVESLFLNPSKGIGSEFAQSGINGPSVFPSASLGIKLKAMPFKHNYFQIAVLDGVPGDPDNPYSSAIILEKNDGLLVCGEIGFVKGNKCCIIEGVDNYKEEAYTKLGIGAWFYENHLFAFINQTNNWGFYLLLEQDILFEKGNTGQGISISGRLGIANDEVNQFDNFIGGSITYQGLFESRDEDHIGFSFSFAHNSYLHRYNRTIEGSYCDDFEKIFELTYKYMINSSIAIQPDIQYIVSPSLLTVKDNIFITGCRVSVFL